MITLKVHETSQDIDIGKWVKVRLTGIPNEEKVNFFKIEIVFDDSKGFVKYVGEYETDRKYT